VRILGLVRGKPYAYPAQGGRVNHADWKCRWDVKSDAGRSISSGESKGPIWFRDRGGSWSLYSFGGRSGNGLVESFGDLLFRLGREGKVSENPTGCVKVDGNEK